MTFAGRPSLFPGDLRRFPHLKSYMGQRVSWKAKGFKSALPPGYVGPPIPADPSGTELFKRQTTTQFLLVV